MHLESPTRERRNAFTLIELMLVCLLVAIMSAMIIPAMHGSYQDALLRAASRKLVDAFGLACSQAVSHNQTDRVRLDLNGGRYVVEKRVEQDGAETFVPLEKVPGGQGKLDSRIAIKIQNPGAAASEGSDQAVPAETVTRDQQGSKPEDAISFYPDGTADGREVILRDRDGFGLALRINPITARVNIVELPRQ